MTRVFQIKVGRDQTGIIGLEEALKEIAQESQDLSDQEIGAVMVEKLSMKNHIPPSASHLYEIAFLREFKKYIGKAVPQEPLECIDIKILGIGCPNCDHLEQDLTKLLAETGIEANLEHVRDIIEISRYGVMGSPALVINGKVIAVGSVPTKSRLRTFLLDAEAKIKKQSYNQEEKP